MGDSISATYPSLLTHFGPRMPLSPLAAVLNRSTSGLRMAMARKAAPLTFARASTRPLVGRRLSCEARRVAAIIDLDRAASAEAGALSRAAPDTGSVSAGGRSGVRTDGR
jgi:hypothetical protein